MDTYNILLLNDLGHLLGRDKVAVIYFDHWRRLGCLKRYIIEEMRLIGAAFKKKKKKKAFLLAFENFFGREFLTFVFTSTTIYKYDYMCAI